MVDYRRKINAFRDVKSCEDYINLARLNNNHNAVSYAKRKVITLKYKELLSELLSDFEIEIRSQIKESLIDGLSSGNYEKR
jgi:hypothetical protein|tara:strand:- start:906 stop:1148 length:243 start_codon:yes stop_codon:yes gene_type:complete